MTRPLFERPLRDLSEVCGAAGACLVVPAAQGNTVLATWTKRGPAADEAIRQHCQHLSADWLTADEPRWLSAGDGELSTALGFARAWADPIKVPQVLQYYRGSPDDPILTAGVLMLFDPQDLPVPDGETYPAWTEFRYQRDLIEALLDRHILEERLEINLGRGQDLGRAAEAVNQAGTYQQALDAIVDFVAADGITACAILLYEYRQDLSDDSHTIDSIEKLRVAGTWDYERGSGIATKLGFTAARYGPLLERLEQDRQIVIRNVPLYLENIDPFAASFLRGAHIRTAMVLSLRSREGLLGLIGFGMREDHRFTRRQLSTFQLMAELISLKITMLNVEQQRLRELQGRSALLDGVTDGVMYVLPTRDPGGSVRVVNERFIQMFSLLIEAPFKLSLGEIIDHMHIPDEVRSQLRTEWLERRVSDPSLWRGEFSLVFPSGVPGEIAWYSAPVYERGHLGGNILGRVYIFTDVTADRAAQRLRASFLARASHELRTPLQSIQGFAEMILEDDQAATNNTTREYASTILSGAQRLRRMVNDMIDITRVEAGELKLHRQDIYLADVIFDVAVELEVQYRARHQRLVFDLDDHMPPIHADHDRVVQVLINLIANAIKYSPPDTVISVQSAQVRDAAALEALIDHAPAGVRFPSALVIIRDQGGGLNEREVEEVFMPFYRTEASKRQRIEGAGLGLVVTRSIIEAHGGKVWAVPAAQAGGGCFAFTLPL